MDRFLSFLGALLLITAALLLCMESVAYDADYYMALHEELGAAQNTGLDEAGLRDASELLIAYLRGETDSLALRRAVYGEERDVFNAREISHMKDVRALFDLERAVRDTGLWGGLGCILLALALRGYRRVRSCARAALAAFGVYILVLGAYAAYAAIDFNAAFLLFHALAFNNDLWLLDPRTDLMIRMLPEPFFLHMAARIATRMAWCFAGMLAACAAPAIWPRRAKA